MSRKRDMDLIRSLMLEIEEGKPGFEPMSDETRAILRLPEQEGSPATHEDAERLEMHLELIEEAGLVKFHRYVGGSWAVDRITGKGHDFIDSVRDPAIWAKTKDGAAKAGGFTLDLMGALAKGFIKKQIQDRTGIEVDL